MSELVRMGYIYMYVCIVQSLLQTSPPNKKGVGRERGGGGGGRGEGGGKMVSERKNKFK